MHLSAVIELAREAGQRILALYGEPIPVDYKSDDSPLTQADRASHEYLLQGLTALTPDIPVLSEESDPEDVTERKSWSRFWCVDPLDGTKEFVKRSGEFTVNVALIEDGEPVLGVVHVPAQDVTYAAVRGAGATVTRNGAEPARITTRRAPDDQLVVVASRDHAGAEVAAIIGEIESRGRAVESASMGSSLKFCLVAEGEADFYPRTVPTFEWDTAAAQCVVEEAGGRIATRDGQTLAYNKDDIRNPSVFAVGDPDLAWTDWVEA